MPHAMPTGGARTPSRGAPAAVALCAAVLASLLLWAAPASADEASGGRLDWGVKESFRRYITGPIAHGEVSVGDGASTVGGVYRFHSATGEYDPDAGTASISYSGYVHFWGHDGELDVTFANPSIEYSGSSGTLYVYVNGTRTDMASLSGPSIAGASGTLSVDGVAATLTSNGAQHFAGYYETGQELDPVSFTADLVAAAAPEETEEAEEEPSEEPTEDEGVSGAVVDWGVRGSWRDYVSGDLAAGSWTAEDGALDGGAVFRFTEGEGEADGGDYELAFTGAVTFTGTDVDLTIADPVITAEDGQAVLTADVAGERIPLAEFEAELTERDDLLVAEAVPTVLAAEAVEVFGGFYQAGDEMDPISIAVPLTADAELPTLPDIGSEPTEAASSVEAEAASTETETNPLMWIVPAAAVALLAAAAVAIAIRQRRKAAREAADEDGGAEEETEPESAEDEGAKTTPAAASPEAATEDKEYHHR